MFSKKIDAIVGRLTNYTDLIVLPETFTTGFSMNPKFAESMDGTAVEWMRKIANEKDCVVCGSLMIQDEGMFYNRLVWMPPDGKLLTYDKRHLFCISDEPKFFTAGEERLIVELKRWKICPLICYDLRFPVWARNVHGKVTNNSAYDILLYVANWPERRNVAWKNLLPARAIENQAYVVGVNRVGVDEKNVAHTGDSMVIDALGKILYHKEFDEDVFTIELNWEELKKVREQLPFLNDADDFILNPKLKIKSH